MVRSLWLKLAQTIRESFPGLKAPDSTIGDRLTGYSLTFILLLSRTTSAVMERPLEDATTANLWKTLFALIVELSLRSGLVTQEELVPGLTTTPTHVEERHSADSHEAGSQEGQEEGTGDQELGEESEREEDPVVEAAHEPDAETEPGAATGEKTLLEGATHSSATQERVLMNNEGVEHSWLAAPSQSEGSSCPQSASTHSYPPEYNPFDPPVGEVVAQLFDDSQPINPLLPSDNGKWRDLESCPFSCTIPWTSQAPL